MKRFEDHLDIVFSLYGYEDYYSRREVVKTQLCRAYYKEMSGYSKVECLQECKGFESFAKNLMTETDLDTVSELKALQRSICDYVETQVEEIHDRRLAELREVSRIEAGGRYVSFLGDM